MAQGAKQMAARPALDELLQSMHHFNRFGPYTTPEQQSRLGSLRSSLAILHDALPIHLSAVAAQLAYFWTKGESDYTLSSAPGGLEFLAQEAQKGNGSSSLILDYLKLRAPWQSAIRRERENYPDQRRIDQEVYADFMLEVLRNIKELELEAQHKYLELVGYAVNVDVKAGSRYAYSARNAIDNFGADATSLYAHALFDWLAEQKGKLKHGLDDDVSSEAMYVMWHYLQEFRGDNAGIGKLNEFLAVLEETAGQFEHFYFRDIYTNLTREVSSPERKAEILCRLKSIESSHSADAGRDYNHAMNMLWTMLSGISKLTASEGIFTNYVPAVFKALERADGRAEGMAAQLLDRSNIETIVQKIGEDAYWETISNVFSGVQVSSPGIWVPDTSEGASSFLEAIRGANYEAEMSLLPGVAEDLGRRNILAKDLSILELGVGDGKKSAALLSGLVNGASQINVCYVDKNFLLAFAGFEELANSSGFQWGAVHPLGNQCAAIEGGITRQGKRIPGALYLITEYFEKLKNHPLYQKFVSEHPDYLTTCLGTTLGNFEPAEGMKLISSLAGRFALIGLYLSDGDDNGLIQDYDTSRNNAMGRHYLRQLGVDEEAFENLEHIVEVRKKRECFDGVDMGIVTRLHTYFLVKPRQSVKSAFREFSGGDVINVGLSVKYTDEQAQKLFQHSGFDVTTYSRRGNVGLYLIERKVPMPAQAQASS